MMKSAPLLSLFLLCASNALAVAPYPSVLTVKYKDRMLPVIHVHDTDPVVVVDGKEKVIRTNPSYVIQSAAGFADNSVESAPGALAGPFQIRFLGGEGTPTRGLTYIEVPLTAKKTIKQGFAVVVIYSDDNKTKEVREKAFGNVKIAGIPDAFYNGTSIIVHDLPELPAGNPVKVKFTSGGGVALLATDYFIQIFDDEGREVRTTDVGSVWQYYTRRDRERLVQAVAKYLEKFKGADHDAVPAMMPKPIFAPNAVMPVGEVVVTLTVESDGTVSAVETGETKDASVRESISNALGGWMFLPRLKAGVPVATKVSFPLKF